MAKRGAKSIFEKREKLVAALKGIKGAEGFVKPSRFIQMQMAERGLIQFDTVQTGTRGRPALKARVTRLGQSYINFAKAV
jgi:hypothetical protein